jgi:hypothetical protein
MTNMNKESFYKTEDEIGTRCPVCGWDFRGSKTDQICESCAFQFNYGDAFARSAEERALIYHGYRYRWINDGMPWSSSEPMPSGWDPKAQLNEIQKK